MLIDDNIGDLGAGLSVETANYIEIKNSKITNNQAGNSGGGICVFNTKKLWLENTLIADNVVDAYDGGDAEYAGFGII